MRVIGTLVFESSSWYPVLVVLSDLWLCVYHHWVSIGPHGVQWVAGL